MELGNEVRHAKRIEQYIRAHSGALLSHGICDDCMREHYPEFEEEMRRERSK